MSKGYIAIAQNSGSQDYIRQAYALALSIKNTQSKVNKFCICVEDKNDIPEKYMHVFDDVIEIPWSDDARHSSWKINNKWKYYYMSPYEETIALDTDMLFTSGISYWWDYLAKRDVFFTTNVLTYRGVTANDSAYREVFRANDLPNIYTAFFYFKKTLLMAEITRMAEYIFKNWEAMYEEFLDATRPGYLSGDVAYALAVKLLGVEDQCISEEKLVSFVHMKSLIQGDNQTYVTDEWPRHFRNHFSDDCKITVCNYIQNKPFHYHRKEWLSDTIIEKLEHDYTTR